MTTTTKQTFTPDQKATALDHAKKSLDRREKLQCTLYRNSFAHWGNSTCISRTIDTIRDMLNGKATNRQYAYWLHH